jgi:DNA-binding CsgD family transcriptional regulator
VPYRGLVVQVGAHLAAYGSADRYLGALAALRGRARDAESHFEAALRLDTRSGMPVWLARTQSAYGRFLAERRRTGDNDRARALLRGALGTARSLGMEPLADRAEEALAHLSGPRLWSPADNAAAGSGLTDREVAVIRLIVEGLSNREIGERLSISQHTAANHVRSILLKSGCANRTEAASWALRRGLVAD